MEKRANTLIVDEKAKVKQCPSFQLREVLKEIEFLFFYII